MGQTAFNTSENLIDIKMVNADSSCWLKVVEQVKTLKFRDNNADLNHVKHDLITQLQYASNKSLSFPAACSLIGISSFIWGVVDLNDHGRNLGDFYKPKILRPLFKQQFFQSLVKYYSRKMSREKTLAFTKSDLKTDIAFVNRVKVNWKSPLPAKILEATGVKNINLCTERFYDIEWLETQDKRHLQRVLMQFYGDQKAKEIKSLDLQQLKEFFENNLCEDSSYFKRLNEWVDSLITEDSSKQFPIPSPLPVANMFKGSVHFNASQIQEAAPSSDLEEAPNDGDDPQTSETEVSTADDDERSTRSVSVASQTLRASRSSKSSMSSTTSKPSKTRWLMCKENDNVYEVCNTEEAQAKAERDLKRPEYIDYFNVNHLIAAIRFRDVEVEIEGVQPYGKGYRVAMDVHQGKWHIKILYALKELPHLYPLNQQRAINKRLKKLKAEGKALTVKKAERNTTLDAYN